VLDYPMYRGVRRSRGNLSVWVMVGKQRMMTARWCRMRNNICSLLHMCIARVSASAEDGYEGGLSSIPGVVV
jgi:hypothetical protein